MKEKDRKIAAKRFAERWKDKGSEKSDTQKFWIDLLSNVYGVDNATEIVTFEKKIDFKDGTDKDQHGFIDAYIPESKVVIEQKGLNVDLRKRQKQSDDRMLTPYQQAKRYSDWLSNTERPRWIIVCNFKEFLIYDMEFPNRDPEVVLLKNLGKEYHRLDFLVKKEDIKIKKEEEISVAAGAIVSKLYDALLEQFKLLDLQEDVMLNDLNVLCVRLVFCLYAEDAELFKKNAFYDYFKDIKADAMGYEIEKFFEILNIKEAERSKNLPDDLAAFPYVNGSLFGKSHKVPKFTEEIKEILLEEASLNFDWSEISPTIFGAVFESTLNPEERRKNGMHYTSIENIHKVINPLFLDDLNKEFENIMKERTIISKRTLLYNFQDKLASLTFLDPACGSGNFLTETYLCLRRMENNIIKELINMKIHGNQKKDIIDSNQIRLNYNNGDENDIDNVHIKVQLNQFCGIEINDFAVSVAKVALWIAESQMAEETQNLLRTAIDFLPLKSYPLIIEGNALRLDWEEEIKKKRAKIKRVTKDKFNQDLERMPDGGRVNYIMGNPPFKGSNGRSNQQKVDHRLIFEGISRTGNLDYVCCWFKKASNFIYNTDIKVAFVATNSIVQGIQVEILWKCLEKYDIHIDFRHRSFEWDNLASSKAGVWCVIIGFSSGESKSKKMIYENDLTYVAENINGYLVNYNDILICDRDSSINDAPKLSLGNLPKDDGNYIFTGEQKNTFLKKEPKAEYLFKPWCGTEEFLKNKIKYCLDVNYYEYGELPLVDQRVDNVKSFRDKSVRNRTKSLASSPTRFETINKPNHDYLCIPRLSSSYRKYIPIGFLSPSIMPSYRLKVIEDANIYHFGILTSNVHMEWVSAISGRLKNDYSYFALVYNNFPWPNSTKKQKQRIEETAQHILDVREKYANKTYKYLYDQKTMPYDLLLAHERNDKAVMEAYGMRDDYSSFKILDKLIRMYAKRIKELEINENK